MTQESLERARLEQAMWFSQHRFIHHDYTDAQIHPFATQQYAQWVHGVSGTDADFPGNEKMWFEAILQMKSEGVVGEGVEV